MQLTQTVKRQLEKDKNFLMSLLSRHGRADATIVLEEEPGEVLITLLMTDSQIQNAVKKAVEEIFGAHYLVSNIGISCGKQLITFTISK